MLIGNSGVTSFENLHRGKLIPMTTFTAQDVVSFYVNVYWDNPTQELGIHSVAFKWYADTKLISNPHRAINFKVTPTTLSYQIPASVLGVGHCKVEALIDDNVVASKEFDITP